MSTDDLARTTFIESSKENALDLPEDLLLQIYEIQKKYQYEEKRDLAIREIEKIIQTYIENK